MTTRSFRLPVLLAVSLLLCAAGVVAACDDTFPSPLSAYDGDASFEDTGVPAEGDAGGDGASPDGGDAGSTADGGDAGREADGGDGSVDGSSPDGESDASLDARVDAD
jgi:hypothetical protein